MYSFLLNFRKNLFFIGDGHKNLNGLLTILLTLFNYRWLHSPSRSEAMEPECQQCFVLADIWAPQPLIRYRSFRGLWSQLGDYGASDFLFIVLLIYFFTGFLSNEVLGWFCFISSTSRPRPFSSRTKTLKDSGMEMRSMRSPLIIDS